MGAFGYRDGSAALSERMAEHRARVAEIDEEVPQSARRRLPRKLRRELEQLRSASDPCAESASELMSAEHAVELYEAKLDEALGLAAELRRSVEPVVRREALLRWAGFGALALLILMLVVRQAGLGDFMLLAIGVKVHRISEELPTARFAYEAEVLHHETEKPPLDTPAR
jgi:hypothetical protein